MKKALFAFVAVLTLSFAQTTAYGENHVPTTTGADLHAHASNAP